jgi:hypothetical protein
VLERWVRSPGLLMTAYVGLFLYAGPWVGPGDPARRNWVEIVVAIFLAWLACRGSRAARVLLIAYSILGVLIALFGSASSWSPDAAAVRLGFLALYVAQVCLLVSAPMYERTRPGWSPGRRAQTQFLPAPRIWTVGASIAVGLIISLLPFAGVQALACPSGHSAADGPCLAYGTGYPIAYRFSGGIFTMHAYNIQWLNVVAPTGLQAIAFAIDWAMWSLSVALVLYLVWLDFRRAWDSSGPAPDVSSPAPASQ